MPPVFFTEVKERQVERVEGRPDPVERTIITRYYTEFDPNPHTVIDRLFGAKSGDDLPPIFYEIDLSMSPSYKRIPSAYGIKPLAISIEQGNWGDRLDWTAQWEVIGEPQPPLEIMGLELFNWSKTKIESQQAAEYLFGHKIFGSDENRAGEFLRLRMDKPVYRYTGKIIGEPAYQTIRGKIAADNSIVGFTYNYNPITEISDVSIEMVETEGKDLIND